MEFEWDPAKEAMNLKKHGISFAAAAQVLASGTTQKIIAVVYTTRENRHRIISARRARENEEKEYQKHIERKAPEPQDGTEAGPDDER